LIFLPLLPNLFLLVGRQRTHRLVLLARDAPLIGRQFRPGPHLLLDPLLLIGRHPRIALGNASPLLLARRVVLVPVRSERRQHLAFAGRQVVPRWRADQRLRERACGRESRKREAQQEGTC